MLKKILRISIRTILIGVSLVILYVLAAYALPFITVNNYFSNVENGVKIAVVSNGMHTDIVVPASHAIKDWTRDFPKDSFDVHDPAYSYIGFGWGDKGFYLETPTWDDLTFSTAFKACFWLSETAMHVRYLKERKKNTGHCRILTIDTTSYRKLVHYIENSFQKQNDHIIKIPHSGYGELDRFYDAKGTYSLFNTCNNWTNKGLKDIGVKVSCWSPLPKGLMHSLKY